METAETNTIEVVVNGRLQRVHRLRAVAPPAHQAVRTGFLGSYGGNMDYNQMRASADRSPGSSDPKQIYTILFRAASGNDSC